MTIDWDWLDKNAEAIRQEWAELWNAAGNGVIKKAGAQRTLDVMWQRSHLDILRIKPNLVAYFPTRQRYAGRLAKVKELWWLDHATAGINGWGTIGWFSSLLRNHTRSFKSSTGADKFAKRKDGTVSIKVKDGKEIYLVKWRGLAGASTNFVGFVDGTPFYLIDINDGCWGEPKRNRDAIQVEMVNALVVRQKKSGGTIKWHYWAGPIPESIIQTQTPIDVEPPFRGAKYMLPYTWAQVITNIKIKRLCVAATGRMHPDRMSQHTDWRARKYDMGPLWPNDLINAAAFEHLPIESYSFMKQFVRAEGADLQVDEAELDALTKRAESEDENHDLRDGEGRGIATTKELQRMLMELYGPAVLPEYGMDGDYGSETTAAVKRFQKDWTRNHPAEPLKITGVAHLDTLAFLERAIVQPTFTKS